MNKLCFLLLALASTSICHAANSTEVFTNIYERKLWGTNANGEAISGHGSLVENALEYITFLNKFLKKQKIHSVVDIGCGDWQLMHHIDLSGIDYLGLDVVESVILKDRQLYSLSNVHFDIVDCLKDELPSADLLLCKDVLIHFSNEDVLQFTKQFNKYKHILIVTDVDSESFSSTNSNISLGEWRRIDVSAPPFNQKGRKVLVYPAESYTNHFKLVYWIENAG